jgi:GMP synthase-like glutamine amidotransferase
VLHQRKIQYDIVDLNKKELFSDPALYNAVFVFGGPNSANDTSLTMTQELVKIKKTIDAKIPYLGICLGLQTMVKAMGGQVFANDIPEIGWKDEQENFFEIEYTLDGTRDPIFSNVSSPVKIFHLHGETVGLTKEMKLLATGRFCQNQVVKIGENAYGFQGHLELTPELFETWINDDNDLQQMDSEKLRRDYETVSLEYEITGRQIITNFLTIAKLI